MVMVMTLLLWCCTIVATMVTTSRMTVHDGGDHVDDGDGVTAMAVTAVTDNADDVSDNDGGNDGDRDSAGVYL